MKVALCIRALQLDGVSHTAMLMGQVLRDAGHDVFILSPYPRRPDAKILREGLKYVPVGQGRWESERGLIMRMGRVFREESFDVVFILSGLPVPLLEESLPLIPDHTSVVPVILGDRDHVYEPLARTASAWNTCVAISPRLLEETRRRVPGKSIRLLCHGIESPERAEAQCRIGHSAPLKLLYVGRLFGRKNVGMLPGILTECRNRGTACTLTIVGHGPERGSLEHDLREIGVAHMVDFREAPDQGRLYELIRDHHALVFPSSPGEGLGLVLLEAQANGCVPVASRIPGVTDYAIEDGVTGFLAECGDPVAFARQIALLSDAGRWRAMSMSGQERILRNFGEPVMGSELQELLQEIRSGVHRLPVSRSGLFRKKTCVSSRVPRAFNTLLKGCRTLLTRVQA